MIATLEDLDEKSLVKILQEPKNSLIKQYQELFKLDGAKLSFKDNAVKEIAQKAINKKTGARGLRSILENILLKTMYDLTKSRQCRRGSYCMLVRPKDYLNQS